MNPQERTVLLSGCRTFNNYELFRDFIQHYCKKFDSYTIITDDAKPFKGFINKFIEEEFHHKMSLPIAWDKVKSGELSLNYFASALAQVSTHAVLFWDGSSDLKLISLCSQYLVDMRVVIYEPGIEATSIPFV